MTALITIQALVKDYLQSDPFFADFAIVTEDEASIETAIDKSLRGMLAGPTGKVGCSVFISAMSARAPVPNIPGTFFEQVEIVFEVVEHRLINRNASHSPPGTLIPGLQVAESLAAIMKHFGTTELTPEPHFWEQDSTIGPPEPGDSGIVVHPVRLWCAAGNTDSTVVCGIPSIAAPAGGFVTITAGTGSDVTLYTTNGKRPAYFGVDNANNVGTLYVAPFAVSAGQTVLARSFHSNMTKRGSLIAQRVIP